VYLIIIVALLSMTGLLPQIVRGIRMLRGEHVEPEPDDPRSVSNELELCYKMLGVSPSSTWEQIEAAYRAKAKLHHPDRGGDGDTMRALNDAYTMIKRARGRRR
jgi:hypothetical protein